MTPQTSERLARDRVSFPQVQALAPKGLKAAAGFDWGFLIAVIVTTWAITYVACNPPKPKPRPPEVRRAQLVVPPRAEAVGAAEDFASAWYHDHHNIGRWFAQEIEGQGIVWIRYRGFLPGDQFPRNPKLWDEYAKSDGTVWVWMKPAGSSVATWIDP
jgi:hypothetical protein